MDPDFRDDVARVVEVAERAADSWQAAVTDFQPPPVVAFASAAVAQLAGVGCIAWGGYPQAMPLPALDVPLTASPACLPLPSTAQAWPGACSGLRMCDLDSTVSRCAGGLTDGAQTQAERCRMLVGSVDLLPPAPDPDDAEYQAAPALAEAVAALEVAGNFMFDAATHRDFLGAVLGTGIERSKVGGWAVQGLHSKCQSWTSFRSCGCWVYPVVAAHPSSACGPSKFSIHLQYEAAFTERERIGTMHAAPCRWVTSW